MAIKADISVISLLEDSIEVDVYISEESGPPYHHARVTIFVDKRDWSLSELKTEATRMAKVFLSQALFSLPD